MALEPITRQEQIIAGKDLEPITRMEKFLKEYGGASSPKLLSELVLTNENCTKSDNHSLTFNFDLQKQVGLLLETVGNLKGRLCTIEVEIGGVESRFTAEYSNEGGVRWLMAIYLYKLHSGTGDMTVYACSVGQYKITMSDTNALLGVVAGYPMTVKVYAT